jgi:hypothetical protein
MKQEPITYQFEKEHACVQFTKEKDVKGRARPKLYIQAIDAYSRQLELSIQYTHTPGDIDALGWELHAYRHPGVREKCVLTKAVAEKLISRILHLCEKYPALLFNESGYGVGYARNHGFVMFHTQLLDGRIPSVRILP